MMNIGENVDREAGLGWEIQTKHSLVCLLLFSKPGSKALEENSLGTAPQGRQGQAKTAGSQIVLILGNPKSQQFLSYTTPPHTHKCGFQKEDPENPITDHLLLPPDMQFPPLLSCLRFPRRISVVTFSVKQHVIKVLMFHQHPAQLFPSRSVIKPGMVTFG